MTGWVRNEPDGAVCGEAQGERIAIDAFVVFLREGPPGSRVVELDMADLPAVVGEVVFEIRR